MININTILNNKIGKYIKNPNNFIQKKLKILNKKSLKFKKNKNLFCTITSFRIKKLKN